MLESKFTPEVFQSINHLYKRPLPLDEVEKRELCLREEVGLSQEKLDKLKEERPPLYSIESIREKLTGLSDRGFTNPRKMIESSPSILGYSFNNIDDKLTGLSDRGFTNPRKMIESSPTIFNYGFENIDAKIAGLSDRGFTNPRKMIELSPRILSLGFENIDTKIAGLFDRGFIDPRKMIEFSPTILGYSFKNIDAKIAGFFDRGFTNPHKMIRLIPKILDLGFGNIDAKIAGLFDRGFIDPRKMVESSPSIFNLGFGNIDAKIKLLVGLNRLYHLNLNPIQIVESHPALLGVKLEKLIVIARVIREYLPSAADIQRKTGSLYPINLESLLVSYSQRKPNDTIDVLTRVAENIQKQKMTKERKRQLIKDFFTNNPESYKIYRDYLKGYPENN